MRKVRKVRVEAITDYWKPQVICKDVEDETIEDILHSMGFEDVGAGEWVYSAQSPYEAEDVRDEIIENLNQKEV